MIDFYIESLFNRAKVFFPILFLMWLSFNIIGNDATIIIALSYIMYRINFSGKIPF